MEQSRGRRDEAAEGGSTVHCIIVATYVFQGGPSCWCPDSQATPSQSLVSGTHLAKIACGRAVFRTIGLQILQQIKQPNRKVKGRSCQNFPSEV